MVIFVILRPIAVKIATLNGAKPIYCVKTELNKKHNITIEVSTKRRRRIKNEAIGHLR